MQFITTKVRCKVTCKRGKRLINKFKELVGNSSEEEVKSLLFLILSQISMEEQTDEELALSLRRTYHSYLNYKKEQERRNNKKDYEVAHIVFGASVAGSLRNTLKEMGVQEEEKLYVFQIIFQSVHYAI